MQPAPALLHPCRKPAAQQGIRDFERSALIPSPRREMMTRSGRRTVPQIFIDTYHVGGCDDLFALDRSGKLDPLLKGHGA